MELYSRIQEKESIITSGSIYYSPVINNNGDIAYAVYTDSCSIGSVILNNNEILSNGLYNDLVLTEEYLFVNYERLYDDESFLIIYDLKKSTEKKIKLKWYLANPLLNKDSDTIFYEGYNKKNEKKEIVLYDIQKIEFRILDLEKSIPFLLPKGKVFLSNQKNNGLLFLQAIIPYMKNDSHIPFSVSNNFLGRLTWNESYRLLALAKFYELTQNEVFKNAINTSIENLLVRYQKDRWISKKYSISKQSELDLLENSGSLCYAMLVCAQTGVLSNSIKNKILSIVENEFEKHEKFWNIYNTDNGYYYEPEIDFTFDGIIQPFNQQNIFGLTLLEAYKLTGKQKYKDRINKLMKNFSREFETINNTLVWHYWPKEFYDGWIANQYNSVHSPSKVSSVDTFYEDISHASWNLLFILEFQKAFSNSTIITDNDIKALNISIENILNSHYRRFIGSEEQSSLKYFPEFAWAKLRNKQHINILFDSYPGMYIYNDFDNFYINTFLYAINKDTNMGLTGELLDLDTGKKTNISFNSYNEIAEYLLELIK